MAATNAFIVVFDAKQTYNFWRPTTAIRTGDLDGSHATDRVAGWLPLIDTPLHPKYPCAYRITAAAVDTVLEAPFGTGPVPPDHDDESDSARDDTSLGAHLGLRQGGG